MSKQDSLTISKRTLVAFGVVITVVAGVASIIGYIGGQTDQVEEIAMAEEKKCHQDDACFNYFKERFVTQATFNNWINGTYNPAIHQIHEDHVSFRADYETSKAQTQAQIETLQQQPQEQQKQQGLFKLTLEKSSYKRGDSVKVEGKWSANTSFSGTMVSPNDDVQTIFNRSTSDGDIIGVFVLPDSFPTGTYKITIVIDDDSDYVTFQVT